MRLGLRLLGFGLAGLFYLGAWALSGSAPPLLWNLSASVPEGLYRRLARPAKVGDLVAACLPEPWAGFARERGYLGRGPCPAGVAPLVKRLAGVAGARVELVEGRLSVDGQPVPFPQLQQADRQGRPMPLASSFPYTLGEGEVLLLGEERSSFDSRYFGPVPRSAVLAAYRPVWTFGHG